MLPLLRAVAQAEDVESSPNPDWAEPNVVDLDSPQPSLSSGEDGEEGRVWRGGDGEGEDVATRRVVEGGRGIWRAQGDLWVSCGNWNVGGRASSQASAALSLSLSLLECSRRALLFVHSAGERRRSGSEASPTRSASSGSGDGSSSGGGKSALRRYVESFDQAAMVETARVVSVEGAALVERQTSALLGDIKKLTAQMQVRGAVDKGAWV